MAAVTELPLEILVFDICNLGEGKSELFGFWYFTPGTLPQGRESRRQYSADLLCGKCIQLRVGGDLRQLSELLEVGVALWNDSDTYHEEVRRVIASIRQHVDVVYCLDELAKPKGTSIPVDLMVRVFGAQDSILAQIGEKVSILDLELDPSWSAYDDLKRALES